MSRECAIAALCSAWDFTRAGSPAPARSWLVRHTMASSTFCRRLASELVVANGRSAFAQAAVWAAAGDEGTRASAAAMPTSIVLPRRRAVARDMWYLPGAARSERGQTLPVRQGRTWLMRGLTPRALLANT